MRPAARVLLVITAVLLVAGTVFGYAARALLDADRFADRTTAALQDDRVREEVADRVTDGLILRSEPDLAAARPILVAAVSGVVGSDAFAGLFRRAVRDVHRATLTQDENTVTLTLRDVGILVVAALREVQPALAEKIAASRPVAVVDGDVNAVAGDLARTARDVRELAVVLGVLTLLAAAAFVLVSRDRRGAVARLGVVLVVAGVLIGAAEIIGRELVLRTVENPGKREAARALWEALLGDLRSVGWLLAGVGAIVAASAASLIRPVEAERPLRVAWRIVRTEPASPRWRVVRGLAFVVVGVLVVAQPAAAVRLLATLGGLLLVYVGVESLLRMVNRPVAERPSARGAVRLAVPVVATLLVVAVTAAFLLAGGVDTPRAVAAAGCNGHVALCDRPLDEVTLPATHNAMSVSTEDWFSPLQERTIAEQLEDGIRGLLIDTHYGERLENGRVRTSFDDSATVQRAVETDSVSRTSVAAAERLRDRLGFQGSGERGMYLCHTFCELGATPLGRTLRTIREFLVTHPGEVVVVVNQDEVTPEDFVGAMRDAGLDRYALTPPRPGAPWPTLGEMVEENRRLVVLAEREAGAAPWYRPAYEGLVEETPYAFDSVAALTGAGELEASCRANRGVEGSPLFLVNHWVNTDPAPRPSNAARVNAFRLLLRRARTCERVRDTRVNLLAVDFASRGDLVAVADALNGV